MIGSVVIPVVVIGILVVVNGVFVAAEFALVGARRSRLQALADGGNRLAAWLVDVIDRPTGKDGYIAVAQLGITLASIGLGMYGEPAVAGWLYGPFEDWGLSYGAAHTVGFIVALSGITFLHVVFGEMIPKALALQDPERVVLRVNPVMRVFALVFKPAVAVLNAAAIGLMRLLRIAEPDAVHRLHTGAELAIVSAESAESGQLGPVQATVIRNVFDLGDHTAAELMTPRARVEVLDRSTPPEQLLDAVGRSERSRFPVVEGDLDHVVGIVHVKDLIRAHQAGTDLDLGRLARPLPSVVASATAEVLLDRFRTDRVHAATVVDERGTTLGLVTLDDVLDEVVDDAGSAPHDAPSTTSGAVVVDGATTLAEVRADHGIALDHPDVRTVAGALLAGLGRVPEVGASTVLEGVELVAEDVQGNRIARVRLTPSDPD